MKKKLFKNLQCKWNVLAIALVAMMSVGFSSCGGGDDKDEPTPPPTPPAVTSITVVNNSSSSLSRMNLVFINSHQEVVSFKDYGTLSPGESVVAQIPDGATEYYVTRNVNGTVWWTAYYPISVTTLSLTDQTNWS